MQLPSKPCNAGKQNPLAVERTGKNPSFFLYQVQNSNESLKKSSYLNALYTNCRSVTKSPHSFWAQNRLHKVCYGNCPDEQRLQSVNCRDKEAATINQDLQGSHYQRINTTTESYDLQQSSQNTVELPCISAEQPYDMEVPLWLRKASFEWIHPERKSLINQFLCPLFCVSFIASNMQWYWQNLTAIALANEEAHNWEHIFHSAPSELHVSLVLLFAANGGTESEMQW